jgi:RNase H-fold protein (predicted Holliday junction resolvase)
MVIKNCLPKLIHDPKKFYQRTCAINEFNQWIKRRVLLSMDIGDKRIGLAQSDDMQQSAMPAGVLKRMDIYDSSHHKPVPLLSPDSAKHLISLHSQQDRIVGWVIGWPLPLSPGDSREQLMKTNQLINLLWISFQKLLELPEDFPILCWDERFSSNIASNSVNGSMSEGLLDQRAACVILQEYLDTINRKES